MAVIVFALSCMPCSDVGATSEKSNTEIKKSQDNGRQKSDVCSPFCLCSCCAGFSLNHVIPNIQRLPELREVNYDQSYFSAIIKISLPIWQPPQS